MFEETTHDVSPIRQCAQYRSRQIAQQQVCVECGITIEAAQRVADEIDFYCDGWIEFYSNHLCCLANRLKREGKL